MANVQLLSCDIVVQSDAVGGTIVRVLAQSARAGRRGNEVSAAVSSCSRTMKMLGFDNRLESVGARWCGRVCRGAWRSILPLLVACSRPNLDAAQTDGFGGTKTPAASNSVRSSIDESEAAKRPARSVPDSTIDQLLRDGGATCSGTTAATLQPDTGLKRVPAATPAWCPFPR